MGFGRTPRRIRYTRIPGIVKSADRFLRLSHHELSSPRPTPAEPCNDMIYTRPRCGTWNRRILRVVMNHPIWALLLVIVNLTGCEPPPPRYETPMSISLLEHFGVSERLGTSKRGSRSPGSTAREVIQVCNSSLVYHFVMPEGARLIGSGTIASRNPSAMLTIAVTNSGGDTRRIAEHPIVGSTQTVSLEEDLSASWGDMMRLEIAVACETPGMARLRWRNLRVEGSGPPSPPAPELSRDHYNVIVVLLDSLRADHIEPYGAETISTPRLQQLARQGVSFMSARSTSSWTRPAVAALLTSQRSINHGILSLTSGLPLHLPYLPAILRKNGYETILIANSAQVSSRFGFNRGFTRVFDHFMLDDASGPRRYQDPVENANEVWKKYIAPAAEASQRKPFFVYLHERDPHAPYGPPPPYDEMYAQEYEGEVQSDILSLANLRFSPELASPELIAQLDGLYSGEVSYMDRYVGTLLDHLEQNDLHKRTLVVFTSDHGEEFWEHDSVGHGHTVYEELLRVPLLMRLTGVLPEGLATHIPVDLADVTPSILDLLGIETPDAAEGSSILPYLISDANGDAPERHHFSAAQANSPQGTSTPRATAITYRNWKLIRIPPGAEEETLSLYNLADDPGEKNDIARDHSVVVGTLEQMRRWMRRKHDARLTRGEKAVDTETLDDEVEQNLRALGYID